MKWFRFYHDAIDDPKVQRLPAELFKFWVNMLCLASRSSDRGVVQLEATEIAFAMRLPDETTDHMLGELVRRNLLEETTDGFEIHNWNSRQFKSDDVSERVKKHRETAQSDETDEVETLQETLHETKPETLKPSEIQITDTDSEAEAEAEESRGADAPPPAKPKRAHRVPDDFTVSDAMRRWFAEKLPHLPAHVIEPETEKFMDHYGSTGERRLDWVKSWHNWMRRVRLSDYQQPSRPAPARTGGTDRSWRDKYLNPNQNVIDVEVSR